jgi:hypothetical protein
MMTDPRLVGAILRRDFYSFVSASFPIVSPNASFAHNWHVEAMAFALTRPASGLVWTALATI